MKYVLFISFLYKKYKKQNKLSFKIDDKLIDQVTLDADIHPVKDFIRKNKLAIVKTAELYKQSRYSFQRCLETDLQKLVPEQNETMPSKIWVYEIELDEGSKELEIALDMDDTNYTNGFMTRSAEINLHFVGLVPKCLLEENADIYTRFAKKMMRLEDKGIVNFTRDQNKYLTNYPCPNISTGCEVDGQWCSDRWIGGRKSIKFYIQKKHKIHYLSTRRTSIGWLFPSYIFLWLRGQQAFINSSNENQ